MAIQDQDTQMTTQDATQDVTQDFTQDSIQDTTQHAPNPERIQVRVAFDVTKGGETKRYWEFLDITFPDTFQKFCSELRWLHWRVQSTKQERWGWTALPSVFWTDMPCQTTMNADNWARTLRFIRQREKGDYIRLDLKCESLSVHKTWALAPKAEGADGRRGHAAGVLPRDEKCGTM